MVYSCDLVIVVAASENRVIGVDGGLPWHYPKDMERFKSITLGSPVIFGRKTHENIYRIHEDVLPDRVHIVLTKGQSVVGDECSEVKIVNSVDEAISTAADIASKMGSDDICIAGGQSIYEQFIDLVDRIYITEVKKVCDGDSFFPEISDDNWDEVSRTEYTEFDFVVYDSAVK